MNTWLLPSHISRVMFRINKQICNMMSLCPKHPAPYKRHELEQRYGKMRAKMMSLHMFLLHMYWGGLDPRAWTESTRSSHHRKTTWEMLCTTLRSIMEEWWDSIITISNLLPLHHVVILKGERAHTHTHTVIFQHFRTFYQKYLKIWNFIQLIYTYLNFNYHTAEFWCRELP